MTPPAMSLHLRSRPLILRLLLLAALPAAPVRAAPADGGQLRLVVILTRHGVRAPLAANAQYAAFAAQPWPQWEVPPGNLTPHGIRQMALMGAYYRLRFVDAGLLTGHADRDAARVFIRADSDQRTVETARDLAAGLLPGVAPEVHARPAGAIDPLFRAASLPVGRPDRGLAVAAVLGRIGGDPSIVVRAHQPAFATLQRVLFGDGPVPAGKTPLLSLPSAVIPGRSDHTVDLQGPLARALTLTENLLLEYADGMPLDQVGWGRVTPAALTQMLELHSLAFDLTQRTFYAAQVQGSDFASHLLRTLQQAADGRADPSALAPPESRVVLVVGHDTNLMNLSGLLGLNWWLPGTQANPVLPGGALVFELWRQPGDAGFAVRTYYVSQSLDQMRALTPLTLQDPPAVAPIFVPGCSGSGAGFAAPLDRFEARLQQVIDPEFVLPSSS
jgi:4-phytase / acid phosphatase